MALFTDNFNRADGALGVPWSTVIGTGPVIVSNGVEGGAGGYQIAIADGETFGTDQTSKVTITNSNEYDYALVGVYWTSNSGYAVVAHIGDGGFEIFRFDAGVATNLDGFSATFANNDTIEVIPIAANDFQIYHNDVLVWTFNDTTYTTGSPAIGLNPGNSDATIIDNFEGEGWAAATPTLDSVTSPIKHGDTFAYTHTGFAGPITSRTLTDAQGNVLALSGNQSQATLPALVDDTYSVLTGVASYEIGDGTSTDSGNTTVDPPTGEAVVSLGASFNTDQFTFLYQFTGTPAQFDQHIYDPTYLTLYDDGSFEATQSGTYPIKGISAADGYVEFYNLIVGNEINLTFNEGVADVVGESFTLTAGRQLEFNEGVADVVGESFDLTVIPGSTEHNLTFNEGVADVVGESFSLSTGHTLSFNEGSLTTIGESFTLSVGHQLTFNEAPIGVFGDYLIFNELVYPEKMSISSKTTKYSID